MATVVVTSWSTRRNTQNGAAVRSAERPAEGGGERDAAGGRAAEHKGGNGRRCQRRDHPEPEPRRHGGPKASEQPRARRDPGVQRHDDLHHDERPERGVAERVHRGRYDARRDPHPGPGERGGEDRSGRVQKERQRHRIHRGREGETDCRGDGDEGEKADRHPPASVRVGPKIDIATCLEPARSCAHCVRRTCTTPRGRSCCSSRATVCAAWGRRTRPCTPTCCTTVSWCSKRFRDGRRSTPGFRSAGVCAARQWRRARTRTCPMWRRSGTTSHAIWRRSRSWWC